MASDLALGGEARLRVGLTGRQLAWLAWEVYWLDWEVYWPGR